MLLEKLEKKLKDEIPSIVNGADAENFSLNEAPPHVDADFSSSWPMAAARKLKKNPLEIAELLSARLSGFSAVGAAPPGFLNFSVRDDELVSELDSALSVRGDYFRKEFFMRPVNIEFVSANPTGPLHLASGRGAAIGDSLCRLLKFCGCRVSSEYYINDAGAQVRLLGLSLKARFEGKEPPENGYRGEYLSEMASGLPDGASGWDAAKFAEYAVEKMIESHKNDLAGFGVEFDTWFRESGLYAKGAVAKTLEKIRKAGLAYEKDGALWFGSAAGDADDKDRVLVKSDGGNTYFLSDIAYHADKHERGFFHLIDVWGADHHGYVPRMKAALSRIIPEADFRVIIHQLVHLKVGGESVKMSKRAGNFISLKELTEEVGRDACRFFFAMRSPNTHLTFDVDLAKKKSNENPVYYVQYVHARICSIFRKSEEENIRGTECGRISLSEEERKLLVKIFLFEKTLSCCAADLSPHHMTTYLTELAALFHSFYDKCKVLDGADPGRTFIRLKILRGVAFVIKSGLWILGVDAPERM